MREERGFGCYVSNTESMSAEASATSSPDTGDESHISAFKPRLPLPLSPWRINKLTAPATFQSQCGNVEQHGLRECRRLPIPYVSLCPKERKKTYCHKELGTNFTITRVRERRFWLAVNESLDSNPPHMHFSLQITSQVFSHPTSIFPRNSSSYKSRKLIYKPTLPHAAAFLVNRSLSMASVSKSSLFYISISSTR